MIEVFKTNVEDPNQAKVLIEKIHQLFNSYSANFDLEDCDKILRVQNNSGYVKTSSLLELLQKFGIRAEVLPD